MKSHPIQIRRGDLPLGTVEAGDVPDLLEEGYLVATDEFLSPGSKQWRPLTELEAWLAEPPENLTTRLFQTASEVAGNLRETVVTAAGSLSDAAGRTARNVAAGPTSLLESWLPKITQLTDRALAGMSDAIQPVLTDEVFLRKLFGAVHDSMPTPVHRFVTDEQFIAFCLTHRERLLRKTPPASAQGHSDQ